MTNDNSGVNTILIVLLLIGLAVFGSWYVYGQNQPVDDNKDMNINVELPTPGPDASQAGETNQ